MAPQGPLPPGAMTPERQRAPQAPGYLFIHWIKRLLLGRKIDIKVSFMIHMPMVTRGAPDDSMAPAVIREPPVSWSLVAGRLVAWGPLIAWGPLVA